MMMLDQVVVGVARKGQGVQPKRIDRRHHLVAEPWPCSEQVLDIMAQNVMANDIAGRLQGRFQLVERLLEPSFACHDRRAGTKAHGGQVEDFCFLGINLQID